MQKTFKNKNEIDSFTFDFTASKWLDENDGKQPTRKIQPRKNKQDKIVGMYISVNGKTFSASIELGDDYVQICDFFAKQCDKTTNTTRNNASNQRAHAVESVADLHGVPIADLPTISAQAVKLHTLLTHGDNLIDNAQKALDDAQKALDDITAQVNDARKTSADDVQALYAQAVSAYNAQLESYKAQASAFNVISVFINALTANGATQESAHATAQATLAPQYALFTAYIERKKAQAR